LVGANDAIGEISVWQLREFRPILVTPAAAEYLPENHQEVSM
jgi:hypothetical protein